MVRLFIFIFLVAIIGNVGYQTFLIIKEKRKLQTKKAQDRFEQIGFCCVEKNRFDEEE